MEIIEPTLLLDKKKCLNNIKFMVYKADKCCVTLRPHFKTHQSKTVGRWVKEFGIDKITAASLKMAEYFAEDGWNDITVAFPVNTLEIERINKLASKIKLNMLAESAEAIRLLLKNLKYPVNIFLKIDVGYHRTGIDPRDRYTIDSVLNEILQSDLLTFAGFLGHAGHSYDAKNIREIEQIHHQSLSIMKDLKNKYQQKFPGLICSLGDTPTCSLMDNFEGIDEIRPGNFIFYDLFQNKVGSCSFEQIAIAMACPVVAKHPGRKEIIIYGGGVHFSKDRLTLQNGDIIFGYLVEMNETGWKVPSNEDYLESISQEHGTVKINSSRLDEIKIGDIVIILPVHACMTSNLMKSFLTLEGERISRL